MHVPVAHGGAFLCLLQMNCLIEVIHMLLDSGADVNKLNSESMSALSVCHVLYYPASSLHTTVAELKSPKPQVSHFLSTVVFYSSGAARP